MRLEDGDEYYNRLREELRRRKIEPFEIDPVFQAREVIPGRYDDIEFPTLVLEWKLEAGEMDFFVREGPDHWRLHSAPDNIRQQVYDSIADARIENEYLKGRGGS